MKEPLNIHTLSTRQLCILDYCPQLHKYIFQDKIDVAPSWLKEEAAIRYALNHYWTLKDVRTTKSQLVKAAKGIYPMISDEAIQRMRNMTTLFGTFCRHAATSVNLPYPVVLNHKSLILNIDLITRTQNEATIHFYDLSTYSTGIDDVLWSPSFMGTIIFCQKEQDQIMQYAQKLHLLVHHAKAMHSSRFTPPLGNPEYNKMINKRLKTLLEEYNASKIRRPSNRCTTCPARDICRSDTRTEGNVPSPKIFTFSKRRNGQSKQRTDRSAQERKDIPHRISNDLLIST